MALLERRAEELPLLRRHGEVVATGALACMLHHDVLRGAFESLLGVLTDADAEWVTEGTVLEDDQSGRMDLVRQSPSGSSRVVVEATLGHYMTPTQLELYASPADVEIVALLVPAHRKQEAHQVLADCTLPDDTMARVLTWEAVIDAFTNSADQGEVAADVEQFKDLVRALPGPVIEPFDQDPGYLLKHRLDDLGLVVDSVTLSLQQYLAPRVRALPMGCDSIFLLRRYVETSPGGLSLAVGVVDREPEAGVLWLRYHKVTPGFATLNRDALRQPTVRDWQGHLWIALHVPRQSSLAAVVDAVRSEVLRLHEALIREYDSG